MQPTFVTLACPDLPLTRAFYEAMGLVASEKSNERVVFFGLDGLILSLYGVEALATDAGVPVSADAGTARIALAHNVRQKEDVQLWLDKAQAAGGRITVPASDVFWGGHRGYFVDPAGHAWEVAWNPFLEWDADGRPVLSA
jgi:catechol 2,3-dioxygenase-like lactoylglutathione lyase family enzyme